MQQSCQGMVCYTKMRMALFVNQKEQRTQLQEKVAAELAERTKAKAPGGQSDVGEGILEDSHEATHKSMIWVIAVTIAVIALVAFVLFVFK
jgi:hypothetical protein